MNFLKGTQIPSLVLVVTVVNLFYAGYLINGLNDYLIQYRRVLYGDFDKKIGASGVDRRLYVTLVEPVFEWIMKCIFKGANKVPIHISCHAFVALTQLATGN